ncbi:tRNA pseudouridine(55) synthase TruB [Beijerinckia indica]|uniref:tRNA pseudouridine synthase B n=1 Tax=Beijerinckia indica subsp. indica (strain ATCC 9039 / DSM 1715 / NCIMB 8712) TaxID=395963 RepID=B2IIJ5_BEII9|nr:tRNA pseudouridine(55) synthase TruB [Beijerinckia indica]ACB94688.1 tRNA pseudouridine synthase B [Beijerinckia indica subsp. indica ATCC 9039]
MNAPRSKRVEVNGWVVLDKPIGMTSTHAVSRLKHIFNGKKAGHAGTLDPLASGILPVAFGEATKTVPYVQDGEKAYRFTIRFGAETDTDDSDGRITLQSEARPSPAELTALLPRFLGTIEQRPPAYSAIKINGERAYDLARDGEIPDIAPRLVTIHALDLVNMDGDEAVLEARCGKGTYVRAIARDLGRLLGCYGHVSALRRTRVGPFHEDDAIPLASLVEGTAERQGMRGIEAGLTEMPRIPVDRSTAAKLRRGQSILLRGHDIPTEGPAYAACGDVIIAVGAVERGELIPGRVFNLPF